MLLESALRNCDGFQVTEDGREEPGRLEAAAPAAGRNSLQAGPRACCKISPACRCVVDLAAMRSAMQRLGGDPKRINPLIPVDLVIDHSVQVDYFASRDSLAAATSTWSSTATSERYEFLRWGQKAFDNFRVVPPAVGIVHQVNLEYLAKGVFLRNDAAGPGRRARLRWSAPTATPR